MANSQSWQNRMTGSANSTFSLNHISELRWHISSSFDRKENPERILIPNNSLHYLITNAQIGDMLLFCYGYCTTIFHLLLVR